VNVYNGGAPDADRNVVRNNRVHHNARVRRRGAGIILSSGEGNVAYNNVVYGNKDGIHVDYRATRTRVLNNTVFGQSQSGLHIGEGASDTEARNNLLFGNHPDFIDQGLRSTTGTNLTGGDGGVVDAARFDAHLRSTAAAIDAGATLDTVPFDHDRVPRPQGAAYDVGAYEFPRTGPPTLLQPGG
jgi:parallel beta-helix repeat protein